MYDITILLHYLKMCSSYQFMKNVSCTEKNGPNFTLCSGEYKNRGH